MSAGTSGLESVCTRGLSKFCQGKNGNDFVNCKNSRPICSSIIQDLHANCMDTVGRENASAEALSQPDGEIQEEICRDFYAGLVGIARSAGVAARRHAAAVLHPVWQKSCKQSFEGFKIYSANNVNPAHVCLDIEGHFTRAIDELMEAKDVDTPENSTPRNLTEALAARDAVQPQKASLS